MMATVWKVRLTAVIVFDSTNTGFTGTSGGGVIDADGTLIALHRGWDIKDNREKINVAVPIDRESNIFKTFCEILDVMSRSGDISVNMPDDVTVEGFTFS
jgi:hypothetical protein